MPSLFKPIGAVLCLVFALCFAAPNAHADSLTPTFSCGGCSPAETPTAPDVTFPPFSNMTVTWESGVFFIPLSSFPTTPNDVWAWEGASFPGGFGTFEIGAFGSAADFRFRAGAPCSCTTFFEVGGDLIFSAVATPEPSSVALILSGVGLVFAMRKRWVSGLQQAS
jgi:PEP-CTERM motif